MEMHPTSRGAKRHGLTGGPWALSTSWPPVRPSQGRKASAETIALDVTELPEIPEVQGPWKGFLYLGALPVGRLGMGKGNPKYPVLG